MFGAITSLAPTAAVSPRLSSPIPVTTRLPVRSNVPIPPQGPIYSGTTPGIVYSPTITQGPSVGFPAASEPPSEGLVDRIVSGWSHSPLSEKFMILGGVAVVVGGVWWIARK